MTDPHPAPASPSPASRSPAAPTAAGGADSGAATAAYVLERLQLLMSCVAANHHWYRHHWLGVPIWQLPDDLQTLQELVSELRPSLIIETGTKYGGSAVFFASLLQLLDLQGSRIITIDIQETEAAVQHLGDPRWAPYLAGRLVGSSTEAAVVEQVRRLAARQRQRQPGSCLLFLDDWHDGEHVLQELRLYAPLLGPGDLLVVSDTIFADLAGSPVAPHASLLQSNPRSALQAFIASDPRFEPLPCSGRGLSNFPDGIWRCVAPPAG